MSQPEPTPTELEAMRILWHARNPDSPQIPADKQEELLTEVRARQAAIEKKAMALLLRATRNPPTRSGMYSKHMQWFVFKILTPMFAIAALIGLAAAITKWLGW